MQVNDDDQKQKIFLAFYHPTYTRFIVKLDILSVGRYVRDAMLDDPGKGFWLFANQISSNMVKVSLFLKSSEISCTHLMCNN